MKFTLFTVFVFLIVSCEQNVEKTTKPKQYSNFKIDKKVAGINNTMTLEGKLARIEGVEPVLVIYEGEFSPEKAEEIMK